MAFVWSDTSGWVQLLVTDVLLLARALDTIIMADETQGVNKINIPFFYHLNEGAKEFFGKRLGETEFDAGKLPDAPKFKRLLESVNVNLELPVNTLQMSVQRRRIKLNDQNDNNNLISILNCTKADP